MNKQTVKNWGYIFICTLPFSQVFALNGIAKDPIEKNTSSPFEIVRGLVVVRAEMNGTPGNFILDTGSPMMVLNDFTAQEQINQANTIHGKLSGEWKKIDEFSWAGIHKFNLSALSMDIGHLEQITGRPIMGLIGYDFLGNLDLLLDFENQLAMLAPSGMSPEMKEWKLISEIPFVMEGHLAVIEAKIGETKLRFGLDTGAGANLLDIGLQQAIKPELYASIQETKVVGLGHHSNSHQVANILETIIAGKNHGAMRYILTDISRLQNLANNHVDGLLGYPFFQSGKFTINYKWNVISIWQ